MVIHKQPRRLLRIPTRAGEIPACALDVMLAIAIATLIQGGCTSTTITPATAQATRTTTTETVIESGAFAGGKAAR